MLYSPSRRLAFVHIHKTGGVSLREQLRKKIRDMREMDELPGAHHSVSELFAVLGSRGVDVETVNVISVLRNPYAHAVSIYAFWNSDAISPSERLLPTVAFARTHSFAEFLRTVLIHDQFSPMLLVDDVLPPNVHLLRLECLQSDAERVLRDELGVLRRIRPARRNQSDHAPFEQYYDDSTRAHVTSTYRWVFEQGYYQPA